MELRVGRHLAGISAYVNAYNSLSEESRQVVFSGVPTYSELVNGYIGDYLL